MSTQEARPAFTSPPFDMSAEHSATITSPCLPLISDGRQRLGPEDNANPVRGTERYACSCHVRAKSSSLLLTPPAPVAKSPPLMLAAPHHPGDVRLAVIAVREDSDDQYPQGVALNPRCSPPASSPPPFIQRCVIIDTAECFTADKTYNCKRYVLTRHLSSRTIRR